MNNFLVYSLGFLSQVLFFARTIAQWFKSEHEGEVISPVLYWKLSLLASSLMLTYGILRIDFAIVLGQFLVYFIYIRNLHLKNAWVQIHFLLKLLLYLLPVLFCIWLVISNDHNWNQLIKNEKIPLFLMVWGSIGQVIFTGRFIYQWISSENKKDSVLPLGFWILSSIGSVMILLYGLLRLDPVLIAAHSIGIFIYIRNIFLFKGKKSLFDKVDIPLFKRITKKVSDKIK